MKTKRVDCTFCAHMIHPEIDGLNLLAKPTKKASCKLDKRVMFRNPKLAYYGAYNASNDYGYIRYCNEFEKLHDK